MRIKIINKIDESYLKTMYIAARTCYTPKSALELCQETTDIEEMQKLVFKVIDSGHQSIAEHVNFTFAVEGISRACSHQLVRHRHCVFSQQSQRYVKEDKLFEYVTPSKVLNNNIALQDYNQLMTLSYDTYKRLISLGIPAEDARMVLPNSKTTSLVFTCNLRELIHICSLRRCTRAQKEIRDLCNEIAKEVLNVISWLPAKYLDAQCIQLGYCPEIKSCGKMSRLEK